MNKHADIRARTIEKKEEGRGSDSVIIVYDNIEVAMTIMTKKERKISHDDNYKSRNVAEGNLRHFNKKIH